MEAYVKLRTFGVAMVCLLCKSRLCRDYDLRCWADGWQCIASASGSADGGLVGGLASVDGGCILGATRQGLAAVLVGIGELLGGGGVFPSRPAQRW
ncbi:hypothetical protein E2562_023479 [Oryza meyeriana var. granulata]|uniref:Uncharacterized protein n=1 Tax=Oryza meyeriana var. granulata TaxID=110450 RepID=A0A6G1C019_9ORYZ|nr:hypothetical protein E2562_023479 [Oryza meyeriana var. granulata]